MSKTTYLLPQITEPVVVDNCHPQKYYLISNGNISIRVTPNTWSKLRDHYARNMKNNPTQEFINFDMYLNGEKQFKLTAIHRDNYGMNIKLHITDVKTDEKHIIDFKKDVINVESKEYHEKKQKYFEENREINKERSKRHYYAKKQQMQQTSQNVSWRQQETKEETIQEKKEENAPQSDFMMAFLSSIVDTNKLNEKREELKKMQEKCNMLQKMLDIFS